MYIPKNPWMICQRTGGKFRRSEMRLEWTGLWVHQSVWHPEHPQDHVQSIPDNPAVVPAFPDVEQVMGETTLNGAIVKDAKTATLTSATGLVEDDGIGIVLDDGITFWTFLTADESSNVVVWNNPLPFAAASGNKVYLPSLNNEEWE